LSEESVVTVCPNPKCRREIEEPILLTILSVTPPKQYEACPYCFASLEPEPPIEEEDVSEPPVEQEEATPTIKAGNSVLEKVMDSAPGFLQRFKDLIPTSNGSQKDKKEKHEKLRTEPAAKKEEKPTKKEPKTEAVTKEEEPEEEAKTEALDREETKETFRTEQSAKEESGLSGCPEYFGYLANRPPDAPIPPQCLVCPKMVDCVLSPKES
jgi:hypothetical protein